MNCRKVSHLLSAYIDGELPGVEYRQIREHLNYCGECSAEYDGLLEMKRLLARLRMREPDPALPGMILQRVAREETLRGRGRLSGWFQRMDYRLHEPVSLPQGLALGACAAMVGILFAAHTAPAPQQGFQWTPIASGVVSPLPPPTAALPSPLPSLPDANRQVDFSFPLVPTPVWPGFGSQASLYRPVSLYDQQNASLFQAPRASISRRQTH